MILIDKKYRREDYIKMIRDNTLLLIKDEHKVTIPKVWLCVHKQSQGPYFLWNKAYVELKQGSAEDKFHSQMKSLILSYDEHNFLEIFAKLLIIQGFDLKYFVSFRIRLFEMFCLLHNGTKLTIASRLYAERQPEQHITFFSELSVVFTMLKAESYQES